MDRKQPTPAQVAAAGTLVADILVYMPSGGRWPRICGCTSA